MRQTPEVQIKLYRHHIETVQSENNMWSIYCRPVPVIRKPVHPITWSGKIFYIVKRVTFNYFQNEIAHVNFNRKSPAYSPYQ